MGRAMNWDRVRTARHWETYVRKTPKPGPRDAAVWPPSDKQIDYIQVLLRKAGRRPYTADEVATLTKDSASRLIKELTDQQPAR